MVRRRMRVFHREHAGRPLRIAWTLEELGQPYEITVMSREESGGDEHLARHPLGRVPVLESDDGFVFESAAICLHLADSDPEAGLIGPLGSHGRALVYQWTCFAPAELEPPLIEAWTLAERDPERAARARKKFDAGTAAVAGALGDQEFLVEDRFTVADVLVGSALAFTVSAGFMDELPPSLQSYIGRLGARPAYERARARIAG
jgi:glutathione S-transferase